jgi:hypothetical protein
MVLSSQQVKENQPTFSLFCSAMLEFGMVDNKNACYPQMASKTISVGPLPCDAILPPNVRR